MVMYLGNYILFGESLHMLLKNVKVYQIFGNDIRH